MTRTATVADIVNKLRSDSKHYDKTAIDALSWGMGDCQNGITDAVHRAVKAGTVHIITDPRPHMNGKQYAQLTAWGRDGYRPQPMYTLKYRTADGCAERVLPASGIERVGCVIMNRADVTDIEVTDETSADATFDFACFRD